METDTLTPAPLDPGHARRIAVMKQMEKWMTGTVTIVACIAGYALFTRAGWPAAFWRGIAAAAACLALGGLVVPYRELFSSMTWLEFLGYSQAQADAKKAERQKGRA